MEPNPMGLPEIEYVAKREALLKRISLQQAAVFMLVENLWKLEQASSESGQKINETRWNYGVKTETILMDALLGFPEVLPTPPETFPHYSTFGLVAIRGGNKDFYDVRIRSSGESLSINANLGEFERIKEIWRTLVEDIPYPITVWDELGFRYENGAMRGRTTPAELSIE